MLERLLDIDYFDNLDTDLIKTINKIQKWKSKIINILLDINISTIKFTQFKYCLMIHQFFLIQTIEILSYLM